MSCTRPTSSSSRATGSERMRPGRRPWATATESTSWSGSTSGVQIGGTTAAARNIISGNSNAAIDDGAPNVMIQGNYIART